MPTPTYDQLVKFRDVYVTTWNSGDKEGFLDNFRQFLGGEGDEFMTMTDPVGTPPRFGLNGCVGDPFDMWQPVTRFHVPDETFCVCGNEICWIMENHFDDDGRDIYRISIENFRFHEDGTIHIRTWFQMPDPTPTSPASSDASLPSTFPTAGQIDSRRHANPRLRSP